MPKLPQVAPKELLRVLTKCGFQIDHTTGSHFILYDSTNKQRVVVAYHSRNLPKGTLLTILKEAGINRNEFLKLLKKSKSK